MSRRRKKTPEPESAGWQSYKPDEPQYWFYGGPWVPPEEIPAEPRYPIKPDTFATHLKPPGRADHVAKVIARHEKDLAEAVPYYGRLHTEGPAGFRSDWQREEYDEDKDDHSEPNSLHWALACHYRDIADHKANITVLGALLATLERHVNPLFHWQEP